MIIRELKSQLKSGQVGNLYVLYGTENYLKQYYVEWIDKVLALSNPMFNYAMIKGENPNHDSISAFIDSPPMMDERKYLCLKNSRIFKSANEDDKKFWKDIFSNLPPYLTLVFSEEEVDKRSVLFKAADKNGNCVEFKTVDVATICSFISLELRKYQKNMDKETMLYFIDKVGDQLEDVVSELNKLISYASGRSITKRDVDTVVSVTLQNRVFAMIDAIMNRQTDQAMLLLKELKTLNEPYQKISYLTVMSFERLLKARILLDQKTPMPAIISAMELGPYIAKKYIAAAKNFPKEKLIAIMKGFADSDYDLRSGIGDEWFAYEKMILTAAK